MTSGCEQALLTRAAFPYVNLPRLAFQCAKPRIIERAMSDEVIAHMRARIGQVRKVLALAHDPRMIEILQQVVDSGEADIKKLEAEREQAPNQAMPPQGER